MVSVGTLILAWRKAPHENRNLQADTRVKDSDVEVKRVEAASEIKEAALALVEPLKKRIDELEAARERDKTRMSLLEQRITDLECELREERSSRAEVEAGAHRLVHQVESLGANPVYRPPKRGTGELKAKP